MIYNWLKNNLFSRAIKQCTLCLAPTSCNHLLCLDCEKELPANTSCCVICSIPLAIPQLDNHQFVCGKCQTTQPNYLCSTIPLIYSSPIKQLVSQFKFNGKLANAPIFAHYFLNKIRSRQHLLPECIIPMPLHKQRLRERGFNQALEVSRIIAKSLEIKLDYTLCLRHKSTPFQSGLSAKQRKLNLKDAFTVTKSHQYKHVAIFDDVVTTGTTVNELARQLRLSGVTTIEVWAIARTANNH